MVLSARKLSAAFGVALVLALAASLGFASAALADENTQAHPLQSPVVETSSGVASIDVLSVEGAAGKTVFVTASSGGVSLAEFEPYTLADGDPAVLSLMFGSASELGSVLQGGLALSVYTDRAGASAIWEGTVWPAYAELSSAGELQGRQLIGAHAGVGGFSAPATLLSDGRAYHLDDVAEKSGDSALLFSYEAYDPAGAVEGSIRYVDAKTSEALTAYTPIPGLAAGEEPRAVEVPDVVESDGKLYRTLPTVSPVYASNPGATTFTVLAAELSDAASTAAGHYMCVINMVDAATGETIASDAVFVKGDVTYTLPGTIFVAASSSKPAKTYELAEDSDAVELSAARDGVTTGSRTIAVRYILQDDEAGNTAYFVLQDGSKRAGDPARVIGTFSGQLPPETFTDASGNDFELVGEPSDYGPLEGGIADAYYLPKGYSGAQNPYPVKVTYVDFATHEAIDSEEFTSSPDDLADKVLEPPARFAKGGVAWIRLDGQESITHNYWSQIAEYTVYYRDENNELVSAPVITTIRVVYRDGGVSYVDGGTVYAGGGAGAGAGTAAGLDAGAAYTVAQGGGASQQVTGQDGSDVVQQRIDSDANPLASGVGSSSSASSSASSASSGSGSGQPAGSTEGLPPVAIAGISAGVAALIAAILAVLSKRRKK